MSQEPESSWAVVTGASSGLGDAFARQLAQRGLSVLLVARRRERLEALAAVLQAEHKVEVEVLAQDLGAPGAAEKVHAAMGGRRVEVLVNNAGYGVQGPFREHDWAAHEAMLRVDILALTELTWRFARHMVAQGSGRILQVASIGAAQPTPWFAAYGAAKAYVLSFSEALDFELRGTGVTVTTISPGATDTEFAQRAGTEFKGMARRMLMTPAEVAAIGLRATFRGRRAVVPGWLNAFNTWFQRVIPRRVATWIAAKVLD
ncbi:MAG: SDR family oxidoreductase [Pseudomonadota bacterium]